MSSKQQIAANRSNAKKSTGPRSKKGREVSRRNALRFGLAIGIGKDPAFCDVIDKLAKLLSQKSGEQRVSCIAREAAEAHLELARIRKIRAWLFETIYLVEPIPDRLAELNDRLAKLDRYERRALSKRKRALRMQDGAIFKASAHT